MDGEELTEGIVDDIDLDLGDEEEPDEEGGTTDHGEMTDPEPESDPLEDSSLFESDLKVAEEVCTDPEEYPPYIALRAVSDMMTGKEKELKVLPNFNSIIELFRAQEGNIRSEITRNLTRGGRLDCS